MDDAKPKFDPNTPFEEAKPAFDPNAPFQPVTNSAPPSISSSINLSPEVLKQLQGATMINKPSPTMEDLGTGLGHGATLGGSTAISGAIDTAKDIVNDPSEIANLYKRYKEHQKQSENQYKAAKERSPIATMVGEAGGSLLPISKLGSILSNIGLGSTSSLSSAAKEGLIPLLQEIGGRSGQAGTIAGIAGGLSSEHGLDEPKQLASDIAGPALIGGGLTAGGNLAGLGLQKAASIIPGVSDAFQMGSKGINLVGPNAEVNAQQNALNTAKQTAGDLNTLQNSLGDQYEAVKQAASGLNIDLSQDIPNIEAQINALPSNNPTMDLQKQKLLGFLEPIKRQIRGQMAAPYGMSTPTTYNDLETLKNSFNLPYDTQLDPNVATVAKGIKQELQDKLASVSSPGMPDVSDINPKYFNLKEGLRQLNIENSPDKEKRIYSLIQQLGGNAKQKVLAQDKLQKTIQFIKQVDPQIADAMQNKLQDSAKRIELASPLTSFKDLLNIKKDTAGISNIAGQVNYSVDNSPLGALMTSLPQGTKSNALLFNMLQNPTTRSLFVKEEDKAK